MMLNIGLSFCRIYMVKNKKKCITIKKFKLKNFQFKPNLALNIALNCRKIHPKNCRKFLLPPGWGDLTSAFVIFADYYGKKLKSAAGENFHSMNSFYTENSAKMKKNDQQKFHPPAVRNQFWI